MHLDKLQELIAGIHVEVGKVSFFLNANEVLSLGFFYKETLMKCYAVIFLKVNPKKCQALGKNHSKYINKAFNTADLSDSEISDSKPI